MTEIPTLETERLILRGWREEDLDAYAAMMADADVTRFVGGVLERPDSWRSLAAMLGHWSLRGFGMWAVDRKSDGVLVGRIGLLYPEGWPGIEVGWVLAKPYWGQGYATEAATASIDFGFRESAAPRLVSLIHPENRESLKVAERLGQTNAGPTTVMAFGQTHEADLWEISRDRWAAR